MKQLLNQNPFALCTLLALLIAPNFRTFAADDHGNSITAATPINAGSSYAGVIEYAGDEDYFRLQLNTVGTLTAYTTGNLDTYGYLLDSSGAILAQNDDNPYPNFRFSVSLNAGTYYLRLRHRLINATGNYTLATEFSAGGAGGGGGSGTVSLAEALDNSSLYFRTYGSNGSSWFGQTSTYFHGGHAAQSPSVGLSQSCNLAVDVVGPGTVNFVWRVSSEACCDALKFSIDGLVQADIRGEQGWSAKTFNIPFGTHTLYWTYSTDSAISEGANAGWVDNVQFTPTQAPASNGANMANLLFRHPEYGLNAIWIMDYAQLLQSYYILPDLIPDLDWNMVGTGDFNSDGHPDIVWQHQTTGHIGVWFMNGRTKTGVALTNPPQASDLGWRIVGVADFNRDLQPDLLWQHQATADVAIWYMNGLNLTSATYTSPSNPDDNAWQIVAVGDFNQDAWPDIVWQHAVWNLVAIWQMQGASLVNADLTSPPSPYDPNWRIVEASDFNHSGGADLLWQHRLTGQIAFWYIVNDFEMYYSQFTSPAAPGPPTWALQTIGDFSRALIDADNDLLPDPWEIQYFGNLAQTPTGDPDNDGVTNLYEFREGSNPLTTTDSDGDGLLDTWELSHFGSLTENGSGDWDADGIINLAEFQNGSNPAVDLGLEVFTALKN